MFAIERSDSESLKYKRADKQMAIKKLKLLRGSFCDKRNIQKSNGRNGM